MLTKTCDICCEPIEDREIDITLRGDGFHDFDLCEVCALPVARFLEEVGLVKEPLLKFSSQKETEEVSYENEFD